MKGYLILGSAGPAILIPATKTIWHQPSNSDIERFFYCSHLKDWESQPGPNHWENMDEEEILDEIAEEDWMFFARRDDQEILRELAFYEENLRESIGFLHDRGIEVPSFSF